MSDLTLLPPAFGGQRPHFPASQLRFGQKRLKVTVVATFEIASNEARDEVERTVAEALSTLGLRGRLDAAYEVIR
jgi:hypothetical protein